MAFIEVKNIGFTYNKARNVLIDISFSLDKGKTLAIVGASGSGKSTLLRLISGILPVNKSQLLNGEIIIDNKTAHEYREKGKLSFMFQEAALMPNLTVKQNIQLPLNIKGVINGNKVNDLLKIVGLNNFLNFLPKHLSGGMKTRVALARSFVTEPELLLLDEPFSSLDIAWKEELYKELDLLKEKNGTTVILVTHDIDEAIRLAGNNIIVLGRNGMTILYAKLTGIANLNSEIKNVIINDHSLPLELVK